MLLLQSSGVYRFRHSGARRQRKRSRLRALWCGKALRVSVLAYVAILVGSAVFVVTAESVSPIVVVPSVVVLVHLLVGVPTFILAGVGLPGFTQLVLGMRENHIVNLIVFLLLLFATTFTQTVLPSAGGVSWRQLVTLLGFAMVLLAFRVWLSKYLSRERIVGTIP